MLSYRHAFHAGNFADVLKHVTLIGALDYLLKKPKPLCYFDTHAGPGSYRLSAGHAQKNREFATGIGRLINGGAAPLAVERYLNLVRTFNDAMNAGDGLAGYPGSPWFARHLLRAQDRLMLWDLHGTEAAALAQACAADQRTRVFAADGFAGVVAQLPPRERRGLIVIDPPYELKQDYQQVVATLMAAHRRFATGVYALWYPVVERRRSEAMIKAIAATGITNLHRFELGVRPDAAGRGMTASGMLLVNPPWLLVDELASALPWLADVLGMAYPAGRTTGYYRSETLAKPVHISADSTRAR